MIFKVSIFSSVKKLHSMRLLNPSYIQFNIMHCCISWLILELYLTLLLDILFQIQLPPPILKYVWNLLLFLDSKSTSTLYACCNISISVLWQNENCLVFSWFDNIFRIALTEYKHLASYWIEIYISYLKVKISLLHHFSMYLLCPAFDSECIFKLMKIQPFLFSTSFILSIWN